MPDSEAWDWQRYDLECKRVQARIADTPPSEMNSETLLEFIAHFPPEQHNGAFALLSGAFQAHRLQQQVLQLKGEEDMRKANLKEYKIKQDHARELRAFYVGLTLLMVDLATCIFFKAKDTSTILLLRIIAGLAVALMIAYLPSLFSIGGSINTKGYKFAFKATGGIAALVMIYFFDPGWFGSLIHSAK